MYLKLFLAALIPFSIFSCAEDYSQYEEEFFNVSYANQLNVSYSFEQVDGETRYNSHTKEGTRLFKEAKGFYRNDLKDKAYTELDDTTRTISSMPSLKAYDKKLKNLLKELKIENNLSKEEIQEVDKSLARLEFYKNKKKPIYKAILWGAYFKLEKYCFIGYRNRIIKQRLIDTVCVGEVCKIVLKSYYFNKDFEHLEYDSIHFLVDGIEVKTNYSLKIIDRIGILTFIPNQEGLYSIKGEQNIVLNHNSRKKITNPFFRQKNVQK